MQTKIALPTLLLSLLSVPALADTGKITISSPADNATVSQHSDVAITYEAVLGDDGDHLHLYLDDKRVDVVRALQGTASVGMLPAGKHRICLVVNTKSHVSTGVQGCVDVTSQ
jgi:hypothetical protein